jgi:hypothetical protein
MSLLTMGILRLATSIVRWTVGITAIVGVIIVLTVLIILVI